MAAAVEQSESPLDQLFTDLRYDTVDTVMMNISVESSLRKCDWRALASVLGFTERQVRLIQQDMRYACKGRHLINVWEDLGKSSLRKLIYALKEANMGESLRVITKDPDLEEVDFEAVLKEYERLKSEKLLRKQFPRILPEKFREVFYPPSIRMPCAETPWDTNTSSPACTGIEVERNQNSSAPYYDTAIACPPQEQQALDKNSVFISYCPESGITNRKFNNQLRRFAEFIQNQGFTLHFEPNSQAEIRKYGGVVIWKEACIKRSKNVIVICTPEYFKEDSKATESNSRRKSVSKIEMDSRLLRQLAYSRADNDRIIPVILDSRRPTRGQLPMWAQPLVVHSWPTGERDLGLCLRDEPRYILPKVDPSKRKVIKPIVIDFPDARKHRC